MIKKFLKFLGLYNYFIWIKYVYLKNFVKSTPSASLEKRKFIRETLLNFNIKVFFETGTYLGDTIDFIKDICKKIYSVEIDKKLALKAQKRFRKNKNIFIINEDSSKILPEILKNIKEPILFWLDVHFSGGVTGGEFNHPLIKELKAILQNWVKGSIILIDDARLFGKDNWPSISNIKATILKYKSNLSIKIQNDIIQLQENYLKE